jgi:hypothetical protein
MEKHFKYLGLGLVLALLAAVVEPTSQLLAGILGVIGILLSYIGWMSFLDRNRKPK